jgi:hypothetical protein
MLFLDEDDKHHADKADQGHFAVLAFGMQTANYCTQPLQITFKFINKEHFK